MMRLPALTLIALLCGLVGAQAQPAPKQIASHGAWTAFSFTETGGKTCYMASEPTKALPKGVKRGGIWLMVTNRPWKKVIDEISFYSGYPFKAESAVSIKIDGRAHQMFTHKETAWAETSASEKALLRAMIRGNTMVVSGTSTRGTRTTDTFSLKGFTATHRALSAACKAN